MRTTLLRTTIRTTHAIKTRATARRHDDAGLSTLEWLVLALGLFLLAGAAIAVINAAVNTRLGQIN